MTTLVEEPRSALLQGEFSDAHQQPRRERDQPPRRSGLSAWHLLIAMAAGTLLIAVGYAGGRTGGTWAPFPFWAGQVLSFVSAAVGATSSSLSSRHRIAVVLAQALQQSLLRWMYGPLFFSFPDELQHWRTATDILRLHHLFNASPTLPVSPVFPGLEEITTALVSVTRMGLFPAALLVTTTGHVALSGGVYYLARRVSRDDRLAAVAAVLFATSPQHAGFDTQFVYLGPALLFSVVAIDAALGRQRRSAAQLIPGLTCLAAVVVTHHVTAAVTVIALGSLGLIVAVQTNVGPTARRLLSMAVIGAGLLWAWVAGVAPATVGYLSGPLKAIGVAFLQHGHVSGRVPVSATAGGGLGALLAIASALTMSLLVIAGFILIRRKELPPGRRQLMRAFAVLALSYFGLLIIRQSAADGADLAGRLLIFSALFTSIIAAFVIVKLWKTPGRLRLFVRPMVLCVMLLLFVGEMMSAWVPQWEVIPGRFHIDGYESGVDRQNMTAVQWFGTHIGSVHRVACDFSSCSLLGAYTQDIPVDDASALYYAPRMDTSTVNLIQDKGIEYVFVDRRMSAQVPVTGQYFANDTETNMHVRPVPLSALDKFESAPGVSLVYDSGAIAIYDVRSLLRNG